MKVKSSKNILEKAFLRQFLGMILLSPFNVITTIIDTLFISRAFGELSPSYLSAIALITPVNMFFFLISEMLSLGLNTTVSRALGGGGRRQANDLIRIGVIAGLAFAAIITLTALIFSHGIIRMLGASDAASVLHRGASDYLKGFATGAPGIMLMRLLLPLLPLDSDMKHISIATTFMAAVDILLDAANVFIVKGGMLGMSLASSISFYTALIFIIPHYFKKRYALKLCRGSLRIADLKDILTAGASAGLTNALYTVQSFTLNRMLIYTGGDLALLANSVVSTLSGIFCATNLSLGNTVHTMIGIAVGEENTDSVRVIRDSALRYGTIANAASGLLMILLAPLLTTIFVRDPAAVSRIAVCVRIFGLALMIMSVNCYMQSFFEASNQKKKASLFAIFYTGFLPIMNYILLAFLTRSMTGVFAANVLTQIGMWGIMLVNILIMLRGKSPAEDDLLFLPEGFGPDEDDVMNFYIRNSKQVHIASELADDYVKYKGGDARTAMMVSLAVEEMAQNIVDHGTPRSGGLMINIRLVKNQNHEFSLSIRDNCNYFDPVARLEDLDADKGLGIKMIAGVARSFEYVNTIDTNHLMIKI